MSARLNNIPLQQARANVSERPRMTRSDRQHRGRERTEGK